MATTLSDTEIRHGTKIGRFVVVGELGSGGMGVVYVAHDRELDRQVALKVLKATVATDEDRMRILREGQAMARVTHPNVITVYEVGIEGSLVFLAQELLDGGTLGRWIEAGASQAEIIDKFVAAGRGLAAAHAAGLAHRDFKPENVLLGKDGRVRVSDFGLARSLSANEALAATTRANMARSDLDLSRSPMSPLTQTGAVMGTPMFMAPEQHNGERADERSDQFSFCVALYHALYGDWPFAGKTAVALADAVINGRIQRPPRGRGVTRRLRRILLRGLSTQPADRYPSMEVLLAELTRPPGRGFRKLMLVAAILLLVAGAVVGGYALRHEEEPAKVAPAVAVDLQTLTNDGAIEWLSSALERGQLDDAFVKYDMAGALKLQAGEHAQAAIAWSAGAFVLELRGHLDHARQRLHDADANKQQVPLALAYVDLATAAIASASGDLATGLARSERCASEFATLAPVPAAMCLQLHGETAAELGDPAMARRSFEAGLAIAKRQNSVQAMTLELALAELDLDDGQLDRAAAKATELQASAAERGAVSHEARAAIVLAQVRLEQAESQKALEVLDHIKIETVEPFRIRIEHQIALGQTHALLGDPDDGLAKIAAARAEAEKQGYVGLALEARLAHVEISNALGAKDVQAELTALAKDARERGYARIAHLAETVTQR